MTITLAAVYTPIALQGGLTGALFREFALTLAGAVFISGIVALVLSPMMCANLLRADHVDSGFNGCVNRTFDRFRDWYGQHLDRTLNARPAVYVIWGGVSVLAVFMFLAIPKMATKELAPKEDQGFIFGIITAPPTPPSTIRFVMPMRQAKYSRIFPIPVSLSKLPTKHRFRWNGSKTLGRRKTYRPKIICQLFSRNLPQSPAFRCSRSCRKRFRAPTIFRSASSSPRLPARSGFWNSPRILFDKAMQAHIFQFGDIDTKIDQPQAQSCLTTTRFPPWD